MVKVTDGGHWMAPEKISADEMLRGMREHWPEAVTPVSQMILRMFRLTTLIRMNASDTMSTHGLSFTEFQVLLSLRRIPPPHELPPTALYDAVAITSGGLTKVLKALNERGFIVQREDKADRRSKPVRLTKPGARIIEETMQNVMDSDGSLLAKGLKPKEMETMTGLLQKVLAEIDPESGTA